MISNLILHIPHASNIVPDLSGYVVNDDELKQEMLLLTDWYTDDLFSFPGGVTIAANFNRIFCDVERFADDNQEVMSTVGMGVIYTKCDDGRELRKVSTELKAEILDNYYYPHHETVASAVDEQLKLHGRALIIDCHSFSSTLLKRDLNQDVPRPDICIGIDSCHTPRGLYKFSAVFFKFAGYTVKINNPYSGSMVPIEYFKKDNRVHSIMIEVNRDLYLVPGTNNKCRNYNKIKSDIKNYLHKISRLDYNYNSELIAFSQKSSDNDANTYTTEFDL